MPISKPLKKTQKSHEEILNEQINKGSPVSSHTSIDRKNEDSTKTHTHINLRISLNLLSKVNKCVSNREGISRVGWILEAIKEKVERTEE